MDDEKEFNIDMLDYEALGLGMDELIDVVSRFKSVSDMSEIDDEELVDMTNALQRTLFTAVGILYTRGQLWTDHEHDEDDDEQPV